MVSTARYRHLVELAISHLDHERRPVQSSELTASVMGAAFGKQAAFVRILDELLSADERFARDHSGAWCLSSWQPVQGTLADQPFAVIDVEATGGRGEKHRAIEVACVLVQRGQVTAQYESLIQPERPLAHRTAALTGITAETLDGAPPGDRVLTELRDFIGDSVIVAHNVAADLGVLNYESLWHGQPPFGNLALDTEELAVRLLPDLKKPSLARVAVALGLPQPVRHRALADARLTARVLVALLARVEAQGVTTFQAMQEWLSSRLASRQERARRVRSVLPSNVLRDLPEAPGVYSFLDAGGGVLYVGKAASLRARVAQHFSGTSLVARHHEALLDRTVSVQHELVASELEALLLESSRIREQRPPYNVMERSRRGCPFLRLEGGPFPRFAAATAIADDGHEYFGPYRTTQEVQRLLATLRRVFQIRSCRRVLPATRKAMRVPCARLAQGVCPAPCAELVTPEHYAALVDAARVFVQHGRAAAAASISSRIGTLGLDPWLAQILEMTLARLRRVRRDVLPVEGGRAGGSVLICAPAHPDGLRVLLVRDGQILLRETLVDHAGVAACTARLLGAVATDSLAPEAPLDADQQNLALRWLHRRLSQPDVVPVAADTPAGGLAATLGELLACAQRVEQPDVEAEVVDSGESLGGDVLDLEQVP